MIIINLLFPHVMLYHDKRLINVWPKFTVHSAYKGHVYKGQPVILKGQIGWDRIIYLYCILNKPVIRDSHFRKRHNLGQKMSEMLKHKSYSNSCMNFVPSKFTFATVLIQFTMYVNKHLEILK